MFELYLTEVWLFHVVFQARFYHCSIRASLIRQRDLNLFETQIFVVHVKIIESPNKGGSSRVPRQGPSVLGSTMFVF